MKICVFGASGRTGSALVRQALERGHSVTVFYRSDSRASPPFNVNVVWGDLLCRGDIDRAVKDADAVVCLYGRRPPSAYALFASVTADVIEAMKVRGVRRLLYVATAILGEDPARRSLSVGMIKRLLEMRYPTVAQDRARQEELVETSGLEWTIVKTPRLTAGPRAGGYRAGADLKIKAFSRISREDLSTAILNQIDSGEFIGKRVVVE